jgi:hypothetical protein
MTKFLCLCAPLLFFGMVCNAYGQQSGTTNVCGTTITTPGGNFTWTSTYSIPIRVEPVPGENWTALMGSTTYVDIPANGSVTIDVPEDLPSGYTVDLQTTFEVQGGGNPCGDAPGMPHTQGPIN